MPNSYLQTWRRTHIYARVIRIYAFHNNSKAWSKQNTPGKGAFFQILWHAIIRVGVFAVTAFGSDRNCARPMPTANTSAVSNILEQLLLKFNSKRYANERTYHIRGPKLDNRDGISQGPVGDECRHGLRGLHPLELWQGVHHPGDPRQGS